MTAKARIICLFTLVIHCLVADAQGCAQAGSSCSFQETGASLLAGAQADTTWSFLVAGHAYGAHEGGNTGLHPTFLQSLDSGFDSSAAFIVLTGDIVNHSTAESWQQVETELSNYGLPAYYVMGNHDNNDAGHQVFEDKFGSTYYAFRCRGGLFIILNSTEEDRSVSTGQLVFLEEQVMQSGDSTRIIFVFFHEILWNSHEKYAGVMSNNRSRYDEMADYSNYWQEVHPLLAGYPEKRFFVIAGDVGGRADAVAAFYDRWDNVTLLASGMGEVPDENYLTVMVNSRDSVEFELVPLNAGMTLPGLEYFSVPPPPDSIEGPGEVAPGSTGVAYAVPEVFNATSYEWDLPPGLTGSSSTNQLLLDVDPGFTQGTLSVRAEREGFGSGPAVSKNIRAGVTFTRPSGPYDYSPLRFIHQTDQHIVIGINNPDPGFYTVRIFDSRGRLLATEKLFAGSSWSELRINRSGLPNGLLLISVWGRSFQYAGKIIHQTRESTAGYQTSQ